MQISRRHWNIFRKISAKTDAKISNFTDRSNFYISICFYPGNCQSSGGNIGQAQFLYIVDSLELFNRKYDIL